jgi:CxxC-x17-CxxC domain-containing protein
MAYNNRNNGQSGRNNFGRRDFSRPGGDRQMFKTVCSECGKDCEVPFKPSGDKPVFCSNCFEQKRGGPNTRRFENRNFSKPRFESNNNRPPQNNEQFNTLNAKLDKILGLLTPSSLVKVAPTPQLQVTEVVTATQVLPASSKEPVVKVEKKKKASKKTVSTPEV